MAPVGSRGAQTESGGPDREVASSAIRAGFPARSLSHFPSLFRVTKSLIASGPLSSRPQSVGNLTYPFESLESWLKHWTIPAAAYAEATATSTDVRPHPPQRNHGVWKSATS